MISKTIESLRQGVKELKQENEKLKSEKAELIKAVSELIKGGAVTEYGFGWNNACMKVLELLNRKEAS